MQCNDLRLSGHYHVESSDNSAYRADKLYAYSDFRKNSVIAIMRQVMKYMFPPSTSFVTPCFIAFSY